MQMKQSGRREMVIYFYKKGFAENVKIKLPLGIFTFPPPPPRLFLPLFFFKNFFRGNLRPLQSGTELTLYESVPARVLPPEPVRGCLGDPALTAAQTSR